MAAISLDRFDSFAARMAVPRDVQSVQRRLLMLEHMLEGLVRLPGGMRMGADGLIGLVPVAGDILSVAIGSYIVWEARNLGMSRIRCSAMMARVGWDAALGAVPVVGDLLDLVYRSNTRNVKALLAHIERQNPALATIDGTLA